MVWSRRRHGVEYVYSLGPDAWAARCRCQQVWVAHGARAKQHVLRDARAHAGATSGHRRHHRDVIDLTDRRPHEPTSTLRHAEHAPRRLVAAFAHLLARH